MLKESLGKLKKVKEKSGNSMPKIWRMGGETKSNVKASIWEVILTAIKNHKKATYYTFYMTM